MRVVVKIVGQLDAPNVEWPQGWPPPREGEGVHLPGAGPLDVRAVEWYPLGEDDPDPFVYVVLAPAGR